MSNSKPFARTGEKSFPAEAGRISHFVGCCDTMSSGIRGSEGGGMQGRPIHELSSDYIDAVAAAERLRLDPVLRQRLTAYEQFVARNAHRLGQQPGAFHEVALAEPGDSRVRREVQSKLDLGTWSPTRPWFKRLHSPCTDPTPGLIRTIDTKGISIRALTLFPSTRPTWLGVMSDFGDTKVFDLASGKELLSIDRPSKYFTFEGIGATSTNITRWCSNKVYIYDIRSRAIVMNVPFERNYSMQSLAASTDGSMAISLKSGKTIEMLQLTEGKLRSRRVWSLPDVLAVGITPEGSQGVAITKTNIVVLNLEADVITSFPREEPTVGSVRFRGFTMSEDRSVVLYGLDDFTARVLRVCPERTTVGYEWRAGSTVRGCSIDAQGTVGAFGSMSGIVEIHDLSRSCIPKVAGYHRGRVQRVGITADGRRAFSWSTDKEIRVWDVATGECERMLRGDSDFRATKTLKERFVLSRNTSLNRDGGEFSIDGTNRRFIYPNTLHDVVHYALLPDCSMAVTGTRDRTLRLWDTRTAECIAAYPCETSIGAVAVSQRTPYRCVVGLASGQVQFFEIRNL